MLNAEVSCLSEKTRRQCIEGCQVLSNTTVWFAKSKLIWTVVQRSFYVVWGKIPWKLTCLPLAVDQWGFSCPRSASEGWRPRTPTRSWELKPGSEQGRAAHGGTAWGPRQPPPARTRSGGPARWPGRRHWRMSEACWSLTWPQKTYWQRKDFLFKRWYWYFLYFL